MRTAPLSALRRLQEAAKAAALAAVQPASQSALAVALALAVPSVLQSCVRVGVRMVWKPLPDFGSAIGEAERSRSVVALQRRTQGRS